MGDGEGLPGAGCGPADAETGAGGETGEAGTDAAGGAEGGADETGVDAEGGADAVADVRTGEPADGTPADSVRQADPEAVDAAARGRQVDPGGPAAGSPTGVTGSGRTWAGVAARVAVVLVASAIAYAFVVPVTSVDRSRLEVLITRPNGTTSFTGAPKVQQKPASAANLPTLVADAKAHPSTTGVVVGDWQHGDADGLVSLVLLASSDGAAQAVRAQLATQALSASAYASHGLVRRATFTVPGVASSAGSTFSTTSATDGGSISIATLRSGRAVALLEVVRTTGSPQADTAAAARAAAAHLDATVPGFTLDPTRYPEVATIAWAVVTLALAAAAGGGPVVRRLRRDRRHQEWLEEQARLIRVRGTTVVRTRRG